PLGALVLRCGTLPAVTHGDLAALDLEDAAGDVAGGLRAEPHHERRDVGGVHGVEGAVLGRRHLGGHALAGRGGHPGAGRRGDRVGGDAVALHLRGGLDGEQGDARLGGGVVALAHGAEESGAGGGVDDAGRAGATGLGLGAPVGGGVPQRRVVPLEVHGRDLVPLLL